MEILRIYTDGACSGNQEKSNFGGWGAVLEMGLHQKELWEDKLIPPITAWNLLRLLKPLRLLKKMGLPFMSFLTAPMCPTASGKNGTNPGKQQMEKCRS